jgi:hypothetical protein
MRKTCQNSPSSVQSEAVPDTFTVAADFFLKRHFVSPHKVIKYMIWSIAAPAAKQFFFVPRVYARLTVRSM